MSFPKDPSHYEYRVDENNDSGYSKEIAGISSPEKIIPPEIKELGDEKSKIFQLAVEDAKEVDVFSEVKLILSGDARINKGVIKEQLISLNDRSLNISKLVARKVNRVYEPQTIIVTSDDMLKVQDDSVLESIFKLGENLPRTPVFPLAKGSFINQLEVLENQIKDNPYLKFLTNREARKRGNFLVTVWDFDEQKIYHEIQKLFFTKRTIYILIVDNQNSINDIYDKILNIKILSENSPIILVNLYERTSRLNRSELYEFQKEFSEIINLDLDINNQNEYVELRKIIDNLVFEDKDLSFVLSSTFPRSWIDLRYEINFMRSTKTFIDVGNFISLCDKHGIDRNKDKELLLEVLHSLGVIIHFRDDISLRDNVFLNYGWISNGIKLLVEKTEIVNQGFFYDKDVERIWNNLDYKYNIGKLLSILTKRSIHFCFKVDSEKYVVPDLLPIKSPPIDFTRYKSDLIVVLNFVPFLPKEIFSRFMAYFAGEKQVNLWKNEVVVRRKNIVAIVKNEFIKNRIRIRVQGDNTKEKVELLGHIRNVFDEIGNKYSFIRSSVKIPCDCSKCSINSDPHYFEYEKLKDRIAVKNSSTVECPESYQDVKLINLIGVVDLIDNAEIYTLITKGHMRMAFDMLKHHITDDQELLLLESRFNINEKSVNEATINRNDYDVEKNRITKNLIDLLKSRDEK